MLLLDTVLTWFSLLKYVGSIIQNRFLVWENARFKQPMAEHEERLMKSLRETQAAQTQAFEDLQSTLKL